MKSVSKIVQFALAILGVVFCVMIVAGIKDDILTDSGTTGLNGAIWITLIAIVVGIAAALIFGVMNLLSQGSKAKGTLLGIGGFVAVAAACYAMADKALPAGVGGEGIDAQTAQMVSGGINLFLVLMAGVVIAIIAGEVRSVLS